MYLCALWRGRAGVAFSSLPNTSSRVVLLLISGDDSKICVIRERRRDTKRQRQRDRVSYSARLLSASCTCRNVMPFVFDVKRAVAAHGVNMEMGLRVCVVWGVFSGCLRVNVMIHRQFCYHKENCT